MEETNRTFADDEGEETIVAPRFDDEETVLARPVVPLEDMGAAPASAAATYADTPPFYSRLRAAPRRSLIAALVLVSALAGSVLGVAGLYFYQKQHRSPAASAAEQQQQTADVPAPSAQATPAPDAQSRETRAPATEPPSPTTPASESDAKADGDGNNSAKDKGAEEAESAPAAERRNISEGREPAASPKHGKKGERDEEPQREERRARRGNEEQLSRAGDSDDEQPEARRVGVITYRPRHVRPRRDNYGNADRLRRIFEGQP